MFSSISSLSMPQVFQIALSLVNTLALFLYFIGCAVTQSTIDAKLWPLSLSWFLFTFYTTLLVSITYLTHTVRLSSFKLPIVAFLAVALSMSFSELSVYFFTQSITYVSPGPALIATGSFLVTFADIIWVVKIGADEDAFVRRLTPEEELEKSLFSTGIAQQVNTRPAMFATTPSGMQQVNRSSPSMQHEQRVVQQAIISTSVTPKAPNQTLTAQPATRTITVTEPAAHSTVMQAERFSSDSLRLTSPLSPTDILCTCQALYPYIADQSDPKEISFQKGDTFEVTDNSGKWWQVRKLGEQDVKIVPSNYMKIC